MNLDLVVKRNKLVGKCPIHNGDNTTAFNLWPASGFWVCRSHQCHEIFGKDFNGFLKAVASIQKNWINSREIASEDDILRLIQDINNIKPIDISLSKKENTEIEKILIKEFIQDYIRPCPHFAKKFDRQVLIDNHVCFADRRGDPLTKRTIIPIIEEEYVVGVTGRSIYDECGQCNSYHAGACPKYFSPKWKFSEGLNTSKILYNFSKAANNLKNNTLFVTESIGNVFRLHEFGFLNSIATFGTQFSEHHKKLINSLGVTRCIYIKDAGTPGEEAAKRFMKKNQDIEVIVPEFYLKDDIAATTYDYFCKNILGKIKEII